MSAQLRVDAVVLAGAVSLVGLAAAVRRARSLLADPATWLSRLVDERILPHGMSR